MKSRIRSAIPKKIIGINISSQKRDIIEDIAKSENAEAVFFDNEIMGQQVGYLCGFEGFVRSEKEGEDITGKGFDVNRHRQKVGMVFQQFNLFNNLTVLENLSLIHI